MTQACRELLADGTTAWEVGVLCCSQRVHTSTIAGRTAWSCNIQYAVSYHHSYDIARYVISLMIKRYMPDRIVRRKDDTIEPSIGHHTAARFAATQNTATPLPVIHTSSGGTTMELLGTCIIIFAIMCLLVVLVIRFSSVILKGFIVLTPIVLISLSAAVLLSISLT